jgi:hypothetical protein
VFEILGETPHEE